MSEAARLADALDSARTAPEILAAVAAAILHNRGDGGGGIDAPSPEALAVWLPECPEDAAREAGERLAALYPDPSGEVEALASTVAGLGFEAGEVRARVWRWRDGGAVTAAFEGSPAGEGRGLGAWAPVGPRRGLAFRSVAAVHAAWAAADPDSRPKHPLAPIVRAWIERPPAVATGKRSDPLLPVVRAVPDRPARLAIGGLIDGGAMPAQLALIPTPEGVSVPLLDLIDGAGAPIMARGRGAHIVARLAVACFVLPAGAAPDVRREWTPTVRELRDFCFPHGWERRRHWPAMRAALATLNAALIPYGAGRFWRPFRPWDDPGAGASLDDRLRIDLLLPPGTVSGPPIDRAELAALGVDSAPRFRAYIGVHSVAWLPGRTQRPVPGAPGRWGWSRDPRDYRAFTAGDRRRIAFGADDAKNRTRSELDAPFEALPGVEVVSREWVESKTGRGGWLILPADAAAAIREGAGGD